MQLKLEVFIDRMQSAQTLDELQQVIEHLRDIYEVEHLIYHSVSGTGEQFAALTYSPEWVNHYITEDFSRIDPVVSGCFQRFHPVEWKRLDWSGKAARSFLLEASDAGVGTQGLSIPIRGPGGQFALFTVNDSRVDENWAKFISVHLRELLLIAHYINRKSLEIHGQSGITPSRALSPREIDTLTLLALGMSRGQASEKLAISEHTFRVYVESARFKLGASNTVHAVASALSKGLIIV